MNRRPFPCAVEVNHVDEVVAAGEVAVPKVAIRQKGYLELDCSGRAVGDRGAADPTVKGAAAGRAPARAHHLPGARRATASYRRHSAPRGPPTPAWPAPRRRAAAPCVCRWIHFTTRIPRASIRDGYSADGGSRQHGADDLTRAHESLMPQRSKQIRCIWLILIRLAAALPIKSIALLRSVISPVSRRGRSPPSLRASIQAS